jgi:hypothetical protein
MKRILAVSTLVVVAALLLAGAKTVTAKPAASGCPYSVKCKLDGALMGPEETYYNNGHKSIKYGHDTYGHGEHHYVIVSCD